jgi:hypothetical protein
LGKTTILANTPNTLWFDNQMGNAPRGVEKVTQDHPFIRFVSAKQKSGPIYFPTSALELSKTKAPDVAPGTYVFHIMRWEFAGPRDVEKLVYEARCIETGEVLDEDKAESLVNAAALDGFDWHAGAKNLLNHAVVASLQDDCRASIEERFIAMNESQRRENRDRIREMNASLDKDLQRRRAAFELRIAHYQTSTNPQHKRVIAMDSGKFKNLEKKYAEKKIANSKKESIDPRQKDVSSGVILVT